MSSSEPSTASLYRRLLATAALVVLADQVTKSLALDRLADGPVSVIDGVLSWRLTFNSGGAFGLGQGVSGLFLVASLVASVLILFWVRKIEQPGWVIPLGLILGGGLGNVYDRLLRDTGGRVVDFVDLHVWPVFNLADASIVTGILIILLLGAKPEKRRDGGSERQPEGAGIEGEAS